jgi:hypothetical protein
MDTPSPPPAPDPKATADAQAGMNRDTAQAQQLTNAVNQVTPDGSLNYSQGGNYSYTDSEGKVVNIPMLTATQTLSPQNQALYDTSQATKAQIGQIGLDQSKKVGDILGSPINLDSETEGKLDALGRSRLDPQFAQEEDALRTKLSNQGLQPGSAAWNAEMQQFGQNKNDAYNQLYLTGRGQSVQEALAQREQPINEISALLSGSQVSQPNFTQTPQASVASPDYMGAVQNQYNAQLGAWQNQVQSQNAMMGGLFGLAGTLGTAGIRYSDRRLKTDVRRVGTHRSGLPLYLFRYIWGKAVHLGVMAQEALALRPAAVVDLGGVYAVDYAALEG